MTPESPSLPRRRDLIVAAEPATLRCCSDVLKNSGFAVDIAVADSGLAAVVAAREDVPDLIFVDTQLRDVPGREAIKWLRSNPALQSTPIFILVPDGEDDAIFDATRKAPQAGLDHIRYANGTRDFRADFGSEHVQRCPG
jgi:CheY-like chemotaxis protein